MNRYCRFCKAFLFMLFMAHPPVSSAQESEKSAYDQIHLILKRESAPGYSYCLAGPDSVLTEAYGGMSRLQPPEAVSRSTTFNAFSITKIITVLCLLDLESRNLLSLDDTVTRWLPHAPVHDSATLLHLVSHQAGLPNPLPVDWWHLAKEKATFRESDFFKPIISSVNKPDNPPGTRTSYSNLGYLLLGEVIRSASGLELSEYWKTRMAPVIHRNPQAFTGFDIPDTTHHARGFQKRWSLLTPLFSFLTDLNRLSDYSGQGWIQMKPFYLNGAAFGGLLANPVGLAEVGQWILRQPAGWKERFFSVMKTTDGKSARIGMGWFHHQAGNIPCVFHSGGGGGYYAEFRIYPSLNRVSVLMLNRTGLSIENRLDELDRFWLPSH